MRLFILLVLLSLAQAGAAQSSRAANPERPTVATHAYAVAPGYWELEQGIVARGVRSLGEATSWDLNLKVGLARGWQLGVSGTAYGRTGSGSGVGDLGIALKWRGDLTTTTAAGVVPSVTLPTGSQHVGLSAGRALGALVGVVSVDVAPAWHADINLGPTAIGAGKPQWFGSTGVTWSWGAAALTTELFGFTEGGVAPALAGALVAVLITPGEWVVVDVGGVWGATSQTSDQVFVGLTTNLGRLFE